MKYVGKIKNVRSNCLLALDIIPFSHILIYCKGGIGCQ